MAIAVDVFIWMFRRYIASEQTEKDFLRVLKHYLDMVPSKIPFNDANKYKYPQIFYHNHKALKRIIYLLAAL